MKINIYEIKANKEFNIILILLAILITGLTLTAFVIIPDELWDRANILILMGIISGGLLLLVIGIVKYRKWKLIEKKQFQIGE